MLKYCILCKKKRPVTQNHKRISEKIKGLCYKKVSKMYTINYYSWFIDISFVLQALGASTRIFCLLERKPGIQNENGMVPAQLTGSKFNMY